MDRALSLVCVDQNQVSTIFPARPVLPMNTATITGPVLAPSRAISQSPTLPPLPRSRIDDKRRKTSPPIGSSIPREQSTSGPPHSDTDISLVAKRVASLQRLVNGLAALTCLSVCALVYLTALPASAALETSPEQLALLDADGSTRAQLQLYSDTPILHLADQQGVTRAVLGLRFDGSPLLEFSDDQGHARVRLAMDSDGTPSFILYDAQGETTSTLR